MKLFRKLAFGALAATALAVFGSAALAQDKLEIKFTTASVPSDWHTKAMTVFKDKLNALEPNRFDIQLYDSSSLFGQNGYLDALERGNAEMAYVSFQSIAETIPEYGLLTAGYLF